MNSPRHRGMRAALAWSALLAFVATFVLPAPAFARAGATNWYHTDFLQSTRGLTNAAQTATASLDYDAWGNPVNVTGSPATAFRHKGGQGYERDADSGLLLLGRRYYDPLAGRFLSRDPIGYGGKDPNLYRYAGNNPVSASDPSGLRPTVRP